MKKHLFFLKAVAVVLLLAFNFTSCTEDENPLLGGGNTEEPGTSETLEVTHSILELKKIYTDAGSPDMHEITEEIVIEGTVVSSDEEGNIYKSLYIQDQTGGIELRLNQQDLYKDYAIGQHVFVKVKGLHLGNYGSQIQIGAPYNDGFGSVEEENVTKHVIKGEKGEAPAAKEITITADFDDAAFNSTFVKLNNVMFVGTELDSTYAGETTSNRTLTTTTGETIIVRTSAYADFKDEKVGQGSGAVSGILTTFKGTLQLILNDLSGVELTGERFEVVIPGVDPAAGTGTLTDAYNFAAATNNQGATGEFWVQGYIVGVFDYDQNSALVGETTTVTTNIAIADTKEQTDKTKTIAVQLPSGFIQAALNLKDNADKKGMKVWLKGTLTNYFGCTGLKAVSAYSIDGETEATDNGEGDLEGGEGDGTLANPFNYIGTKNAQGKPEHLWVKGYIVGVINNNKLSTDIGTVNTNIAIADVAGETDLEKITAVQLPAGFSREALNLVDNPALMGTQVWVKGSLVAYFGLTGVKELSAYSLDGTTEQVEPEAETFVGALADILGSALTNTSIDFATYNVIESEALWVAANGKATINAYGKGATESWMISKTAIDFSTFTTPVLYVEETIKYLKGLEQIKVKYSTDYTGTGNPTEATWTDLASKVERTGETVSSEFPIADKTTPIYIAFVNTATESSATTWEISTVEAREEAITDGGEGEGEGEGDGSSNDGSLAKPFTVTEKIADNSGSGYVRGYIVGYFKGTNSVDFAVTSTTIQSNLALADSPDETDPAKCIPVQLPSGDVRNALGNMSVVKGQQVSINGSFVAYFSMPGLKGASKYSFDGVTELP